ncbi:MAG: DUF2007 domain-containing protein [Steroidobacteraceae bacterium]|nr:DUF2007 domain-containing protein [Steroidobacteraceae bacterium]
MPKFVFIDSFTSPLDAHVARGLLESEGIPALLHSEHHVWSNWPLSQALGGVRLQVPEEYARTARDLLARQRSGEFERALEEQQELATEHCPRCGATDLRYRRNPWLVLLLVATLGLSGIIFPPGIRGRQCSACGQTIAEQP